MRFLLVFILLLGSCGKFSKNDPLAYIQKRPVAPYVTSVAPTGSMEPILHGGDIISITPIDIKDVQVGMLIEFWWAARGIPVVHQVIAKETAGNGQTYLVTKGFNNSFPDQNPLSINHVTTQEDLIGKVTVVRRNNTL